MVPIRAGDGVPATGTEHTVARYTALSRYQAKPVHSRPVHSTEPVPSRAGTQPPGTEEGRYLQSRAGIVALKYGGRIETSDGFGDGILPGI